MSIADPFYTLAMEIRDRQREVRQSAAPAPYALAPPSCRCERAVTIDDDPAMGPRCGYCGKAIR